MAQGNEPTTPVTEPDGNRSGTSIDKFKSGEERDRAYTELEKLTRTQAEAVATLSKQVEDLTVTIGGAQQQDYGQYDQGYGRGQPQHQVPSQQETMRRFYSDPLGVIDEKLNHVANTVLTAIDQRLANQAMIDDFKRENPDLVRHEAIVASFVRNQPQNLPPKEKLMRSAKDARAYLADIARGQGSPQQTNADPNTYVEPPTGTRTVVAPTTEPELSNEDETVKWLKEREVMRHKRML